MYLCGLIYSKLFKMKQFKIILILFIISYYSKATRFNNDSLKNKYELNDPRNPNCPCHKYQKLANEEFKKLNQNNTNAITNSKFNTKQVLSASSSNPLIKKKNFKNITLLHHKNKAYKIFNFNKGHRGKKKYFLRNNKNVSSCFHWK